MPGKRFFQLHSVTIHHYMVQLSMLAIYICLCQELNKMWYIFDKNQYYYRIYTYFFEIYIDLTRVLNYFRTVSIGKS